MQSLRVLWGVLHQSEILRPQKQWFGFPIARLVVGHRGMLLATDHLSHAGGSINLVSRGAGLLEPLGAANKHRVMAPYTPVVK